MWWSCARRYFRNFGGYDMTYEVWLQLFECTVEMWHRTVLDIAVKQSNRTLWEFFVCNFCFDKKAANYHIYRPCPFFPWPPVPWSAPCKFVLWHLRGCSESCLEIECSLWVSWFVVDLRCRYALIWIYSSRTDAEIIAACLEELFLDTAINGCAGNNFQLWSWVSLSFGTILPSLSLYSEPWC